MKKDRKKDKMILNDAIISFLIEMDTINDQINELRVKWVEKRRGLEKCKSCLKDLG